MEVSSNRNTSLLKINSANCQPLTDGRQKHIKTNQTNSNIALANTQSIRSNKLNVIG